MIDKLLAAICATCVEHFGEIGKGLGYLAGGIIEGILSKHSHVNIDHHAHNAFMRDIERHLKSLPGENSMEIFNALATKLEEEIEESRRTRSLYEARYKEIMSQMQSRQQKRSG